MDIMMYAKITYELELVHIAAADIMHDALLHGVLCIVLAMHSTRARIIIFNRWVSYRQIEHHALLFLFISQPIALELVEIPP